MAISRIAPERLPRYENSFEAKNVRYRFRWMWNNRLNGWYVSIYDVDGNAVIEGERVSANSRVGLGSSLDFVLAAGGSDEFTTWEEWPAGDKMPLYLLE